MSQDLFAAFGVPSSDPLREESGGSKQPQFLFDDFSGTSANGGYSNHHDPQSIGQIADTSELHGVDADEGFEEDWGEFEGGTTQPEPKFTVPIVSHASKRSIPTAAIPTAASSRSSKKSSSWTPVPTARKSNQRSSSKEPVPVAVQFSRWLDEEDDGFVDYEASKSVQPRNAKWDFTKPEPVMPSSTKWDFTKPEPAKPNPLPQARDPQVLFDADDEQLDQEDDDFGDFEEPTSEPAASNPPMDNFLEVNLSSLTVHRQDFLPTQAPQQKSDSLLDLENMSIGDDFANTSSSATQAAPTTHASRTPETISTSKPIAPSFSIEVAHDSIINDILDAKVQPSASQSRSQFTISEKLPEPSEPEEKWDDFEAWDDQGSSEAANAKSNPPLEVPPSLTSDAGTSSLTSPPTNIPPPALVLSLFSPLFASADSSFFKPVRQESQQLQHAVYSDPAAITYLQGLLALATVCGRVIAGHKLRWKRDTILAQSMRIGPSVAGGVSGLKLTSIDKAETSKEEREAADALKAWQMQVGKVKSAIAEVKRLKGVDVGKIPELRDTMPVRVAKEIEGGLKGNRPCALCGLKREERVPKVDFEVEDSFGEWWVDNVSMHRACRNFWEQHKDSLRQR